MQHAFERAVSRLFVRLGVPGTYRLADGREIATRFIAKQGDVVESFGDTRLALATHRFDVMVRDLILPCEGERFTVSGYRFSGNTLGREKELDAMMELRGGDVFNGQRLADSTRAMTELYGSIGYAFANVNAIPEVDREKRTVFFNVTVDVGRRAYVRRINISGNARSRDEVIRRELRQFESAWYDTDKIRLSRARLTLLSRASVSPA